MKTKFDTVLAGAFFVFAAGYFVSFLVMPTTDMIGDTRGYDPGGRAIPMVASGAMALLSLWLLIRSFRTEGAAKAGPPVPLGLLVANIVISAAYIALFRQLGYILATGLVLYWLTVLNLRAVGAPIGWAAAGGWMLATLAYLVASYAILRGVIRGMFWTARQYAMPMAREPVLQAAITGVVLAAIFLLTGMMLKRAASCRDMARAVQSAVGTTMAIYVVFRLLFLVQLPAGVLNW